MIITLSVPKALNYSLEVEGTNPGKLKYKLINKKTKETFDIIKTKYNTIEIVPPAKLPAYVEKYLNKVI